MTDEELRQLEETIYVLAELYRTQQAHSENGSGASAYFEAFFNARQKLIELGVHDKFINGGNNGTQKENHRRDQASQDRRSKG